MYNKASETCLQTLKNVIRDISETTNTNSGKEILVKIKNTMSDRAAAEKKFHALLEDYRQELLPLMYSNWDSLSSPEKEKLSRMNNFYCGLHILVNFAEVADHVVRDFENIVKDSPLGAEAHSETARYARSNESGTVRLIRTSAKCLARSGDEKSGCYMDFMTFLNQKDEDEDSRKQKRSSLLVPFRGNRFNILFYDTEVVFYLSDLIQEFFDKVCIPAYLLQKAVSYDVHEPLYLSLCKALGLCSKLITDPFWRALERNCSLQEASSLYRCLFTFLERVKDDSTDFMCGIDVPFPEQLHRDEMFDRMMQVGSFDQQASLVLQQMCLSWFSLLQKAASDHLQGGKYSTVDETMQTETKSVPRHNKFPERIFAFLDALTRFHPAASTLCNESHFMFALNKTGEWLSSLSETERLEYLNTDRSKGRQSREKYKARIKEVDQTCREILRQKRQVLEKKAHKEYLHREEITNNMLYYGLWQFPETVDQHLKSITSDSEKRKALKTQLQFRHVVLGQQHPDKKVFQLSEKGKLYSIKKLTENVKTLITSALKFVSSSPDNIFIGKRVIHYQQENDIRRPFYGRVISTMPGYPAWFNVIYDNDISVYVYKLAEDYTAGDRDNGLKPQCCSFS